MKKIILILIILNYTETDSWVEYSTFTQFPIQNIPYGVCFFKKLKLERCCSRIGDYIIDLFSLENKGLLDNEYSVRLSIIKIFHKNSKSIDLAKESLYSINDIEMRMPIKVSEYTDFYSSKNHAFNMGSIIRGTENAIHPNWFHMPIAYHGN